VIILLPFMQQRRSALFPRRRCKSSAINVGSIVNNEKQLNASTIAVCRQKLLIAGMGSILPARNATTFDTVVSRIFNPVSRSRNAISLCPLHSSATSA
jgi:hypothetical protein